MKPCTGEGPKAIPEAMVTGTAQVMPPLIIALGGSRIGSTSSGLKLNVNAASSGRLF
jgi:hypothetical protein